MLRCLAKVTFFVILVITLERPTVSGGLLFMRRMLQKSDEASLKRSYGFIPMSVLIVLCDLWRL